MDYSKVTQEILNKLTAIVGEEYVIHAEERMQPFSHDETEDLRFFPEVVVKPANVKEVSEIVKLVNEEKVTGSYEVKFSAIGGSASGGDSWNLPSGIYFYQLKAGNFIETKKMVLLR